MPAQQNEPVRQPLAETTSAALANHWNIVMMTNQAALAKSFRIQGVQAFHAR
jgi:hypothetical protein